MATPPTVNPAQNQALVTPGGSSTQGTSSNTTSTADSALINQIQNRLLNQSDIVSSANTGLENKVNDIISGVQTGEKAGEQAIALNYNQKEQQAQETGTQALTSAEEAQRGFATNYAALQRIKDDTAKNIQNLEQQKQQLILQGQSQAAQTISGLQLQSLQYQQQAQQQVFTNLLNLATFAQSKSQFNQQMAQSSAYQTFQEQQAISSVALKYGLTVQPNDTIASITSRAMPMASEEEKQQLSLQQAQIREANANTAKALTDAQQGNNYDVGLLSDLYAANPAAGGAILANVKDPNTQAEIISLASQKQYTSMAQSDLNSGVSYQTARNQIISNTTMSPVEQAAALSVVDNMYAKAGKISSETTSGTPIQVGAPDWTTSKYAPSPVTPAQRAAAVAALSKALQGTAFGKK